MKKCRILPILIIITTAVNWVAGSAPARQQNGEDPAKLSEYHFVVRGKISGKRGVRPEQIAQMDTNGEILIACREAKTAGQLNSLGIEFIQSQLDLLTDWNLLAFDRATQAYTTTIHIYGSGKASSIREQVLSAAVCLSTSLKQGLASLKSHLEISNHNKSLFAVFYAYILHDFPMRQFGPEIYQKPQLSEEKPFWNGFAWAIYPIRRFDISVSTFPGQDSRFFFVSSNALPGPDFQQLMSLIKDASSDRKVDDPELVKILSEFGLCESDGELTILVLDSDWAVNLESMAEEVYFEITALADAPEMKSILGMETQAQAAMFLHYELRYAFLRYALENGIIETPMDFSNASNNSAADKKHLVFMIKQ